MRVHFLLDPVSGWTCWIPQGTAEADPQADKDRPAALQRSTGQSLAVRLLCRVGSWFGVGEQAPSRIPASRCDPWELGAHRHRTVWSRCADDRHPGRSGPSPARDVALRLSQGGMVVRVELFVDPACMWSWLTSRWLVEVTPLRSLEVRWRPYSLLLRDGPEGLEDWKARVWGASLRAVRVMQALDSETPDGVRGFYEAVVTQAMAAYNAGRPPFQELEGALVAAGLASTYAGAAEQVAWDEPIRQSMAEVSAVVGEGVGTPALVLYLDPSVGLLGPLVSPPPIGAEAVRLWDAVVAFATVPGVLELSRPRPQRPQVPGLRW